MAADHSILTAPAPLPGQIADDDPALWYKDAIIYEAHVRSFFDSNDDGVGDFRGLTLKLDYLQSLGITCLWLLPFFPSPLKDDGYDISDYRGIHPSYGTLDDFNELVAQAHARNIKVLIELVVNHTSDQHPWFQRARQAPKGSPERDFYVWSDTDKKFPETRIIFVDTEKSNWTYDPVAKQYYWHRFFSHQPDLNHDNPAVVDAVIDVMKFWLDLGVDALRLDAVPYLCVREGTTNENLPETHAVLKRMRRELDARYKNRMLLAEANQWPADVRPYFGDGDECHMAFHFPLMPRMFMAIRQEDRHAITEILGQTPEIPDTAQWALFLRNHDELTLEMVTDEERDYMYAAYAADPHARLNLGIRRRLAPLVENSRRRIEILNAMLFSFPGTPVVYYGDELGMGDNLYLGDRNGVRTPMQWSSDRNGGFSRADPARLFAPPVQDPVYGFQSINVEAQERYPFSPLNWMKRLIALRKQHRVFGRGSLEMIGCSNRKVLAYLRRDEHETILCVVNLARTVQPASLDMREHAGLVPIEMLGLTEFPKITDQPYFLTLGPYAFYWFSLTDQPVPLTHRAADGVDTRAVDDALPTLLVGADWTNVLDGSTRTVLEKLALIPFLQRQRWFASRTRELRQARFTDWATIRSGRTPAFLTVASYELSDGRVESYFVPLTLLADEPAQRFLKEEPAAVMAHVAGARKGVLADGFFDDDVFNRIIDMVLTRGDVDTKKGSIHGVVTGAKPTAPALDAERRWTRPTSHQSNSLAFVNDQRVLKLFRRIEPMINPEYEIGRFLAERKFTRTPALDGALEYHRSGLEPGTLAIVERAVTHQGTGWDFMVEELRRYYERVAARGATIEERNTPADNDAPAPFFDSLTQYAVRNAEMLGRRTAELHAALAHGAAAAFAPEPMNPMRLQMLSDEMLAQAETSLETLTRRLDSLNAATRPLALAVLKDAPAIRSRFDDLRSLASGGSRIRVHGDYHLGQVLRTEEDFVILDFEGEPDRSITERRTKQSPVKDVAGMMRSFSYAAYAALFAFGSDEERLEPWALAWQDAAVDAFVEGYRAAVSVHRRLAEIAPRAGEWTTMLRAYVLLKGLYELNYELNHRPEWVRIPLVGIRKLIE